jgi:hypothetical protein
VTARARYLFKLGAKSTDLRPQGDPDQRLATRGPSRARGPARIQGNIDRVSSGARDVTVVPQATDIVIEGWAYVNQQSPSAVLITVDGKLAGGTTTFFDRADVRARIGGPSKSPCGWRIEVRANRLEPGTHVIEAVVPSEGAITTLGSPRQLKVLAKPAGR